MALLMLMRLFLRFLPLHSLGVAAVARHKTVANRFRIAAILPTLTTTGTKWKFARELVFISFLLLQSPTTAACGVVAQQVER